MRIFKSNSGVSHLLGYMLTLSLTVVIITVTMFMTNALIDEKARDAAEIFAENIANKVASAIKNVCAMKEQYPNVNYSAVLEIPYELVDRFPYYIEIDKNGVYVRSTDGFINKMSTIYNVTEKQAMGISGRIYGGGGVINISCNSFDYVHKFDFGTNTSSVSTDYTKISNFSHNYNWHDMGWNYRTPIYITNPVEKILTNYQILVKLDDTNFDYSLASTNGSDLLFVDKNGNELNYWIERWYPRDTHVSRIWVKVASLSYPEDTIYMYHGNIFASPRSDGVNTFDFFDDFEVVGSPNPGNWSKYENQSNDVYIEDGILVIKNGSAVNSLATIGSSPCVIETKAKTVGDLREASMFARHDGSTSIPYEKAYLFTSSNYPGVNKNLSIFMDNSILVNSSESPVNQGWNRLTYIINDTTDADTIVCRYFYENYTVDDVLFTPAAYQGNLHFGLCTTMDETTAYYDWIFVRKFEANVSVDVSSREESVPIAYVSGTDSLDYEWDNLNDVKSAEYTWQGISYDFVYNAGQNPAIFRIRNFTNYVPAGESCSLVFTIGDLGRNIENMEITVTGTATETVSCNHSYKKVMINVPQVTSSTLEITFDDGDSGPSYYWAVSDLTIQRGERTIDVSGG